MKNIYYSVGLGELNRPLTKQALFRYRVSSYHVGWPMMYDPACCCDASLILGLFLEARRLCVSQGPARNMAIIGSISMAAYLKPGGFLSDYLLPTVQIRE
ncbi:hypothetical protein GWI33_002430 [Rhynchophorus ferrugineus]|uniref:Uncharacterized protein n=1 Tax=Rhynchophorus ferrugineus TaxID=354439 RepID=A0A834IZK4_RHYFE|nr:hypothetical protein GWI33_002430 [Rhynchophorus ferrugineus]